VAWSIWVGRCYVFPSSLPASFYSKLRQKHMLTNYILPIRTPLHHPRLATTLRTARRVLLIRHRRAMFIHIKHQIRVFRLPCIVALGNADLVDEIRAAELALVLQEEVACSKTVWEACLYRMSTSQEMGNGYGKRVKDKHPPPHHRPRLQQYPFQATAAAGMAAAASACGMMTSALSISYAIIILIFCSP
jgi:hypothetical protein